MHVCFLALVAFHLQHTSTSQGSVKLLSLLMHYYSGFQGMCDNLNPGNIQVEPRNKTIVCIILCVCAINQVVLLRTHDMASHYLLCKLGWS